jgi:cytochrome c
MGSGESKDSNRGAADAREDNKGPQSQPEQEIPKRVVVTSKDLKDALGRSRDDVQTEIQKLREERRRLDDEGREKAFQKLQRLDSQRKKEITVVDSRAWDKNVPLDGDIYQGSRVFMKHCASCHTLDSNNAGIKSRIAPPLGLIFGRMAGADRFYNYTPALVGSNVAWREKALFQFMKDPRSVIPDNKCGLAQNVLTEEERADLVAFFKGFTKNLRQNMEIQARKTYGNEYVENQQRARGQVNSEERKRFSD